MREFSLIPAVRPVLRPAVRPSLTKGGGVEAEATALFARFTTAPTAPRKALINTLIKSLKSAGVWTKLDALYLFAAADAQAARQNWIQDLYNATAVSSPTFTADRGYAGDGAASYVDSNFKPSTATTPKFVQDSAYFGIWSRSSGQLSSSVAGGTGGVGQSVTLLPRNPSNVTTGRANQSAAATSGATTTDGTGLYGAARSASNAMRVARNGANVATGSDVSVAVPTTTIRFGNMGGAAFSTLQFAGGLIGQNITVSEEASVYAAMLTYLTAVGAA